MTEKMTVMAKEIDQGELARQLLAQAKEQGVELVGPGGLLNQLTGSVLETALEEEMTEHLGYDKHDAAGRGSGNSRNGTRSKTVLTEIGPVQIEVPRDVNGSFDPQIVRKRQRRLTGVDQIILSLSARGLTTERSPPTSPRCTGRRCPRTPSAGSPTRCSTEMAEWCNRPLDRVYPVIFIDAIVVKVRDGQVTNRPVYVVIGVTVSGERDILGLWAGDGGEGAKFWLAVLTELKNRGVEDVCIAVCDGLKGLPAMRSPPCGSCATVQTCIIHLIRNTFRYASRKYWDAIAKDLRPVYTARQRGRGTGAVRGVRRQVGRAVPGDHQAVGERLERVRPVPGLRRGDPPRHLLHQRDRVAQRPLPAGGQSPRTLPDRASRAEVPVPGDQIARPHRQGPGTMGHAVETGPQRVRHHLRRPDHTERHQLDARPRSTVYRTLPRLRNRRRCSVGGCAEWGPTADSHLPHSDTR